MSGEEASAADRGPAIDQEQVIRSLAHHIALVEAKLWGTVRYLIDRGVLDQADYLQWMEDHGAEISEVRAFHHQAIAHTLAEQLEE